MNDLSGAARAWAKALDCTPYVPMTRAERIELFSALAGRLAAGLGAEPFDPMTGYWVATDLVAAGFDAPEALGRSIAVIETELATVDGERTRELVQQFATGFARAVRDRTLDAQEQMRTAALTTRVRAEQALRHAVLHDALTGLPSRVLFLSQLRRLCTGPRPDARFGVCLLGLDGLDAVKTSLGPSIGDQLLQVAAVRLRMFAAESGHLAARWGDDQFAVLVEDTSCVDDVAKVADLLLARLAAPYRIGDLDRPVAATAGIVERPAAGADPVEVVRAADLARHWAVTDGTGWMVFDDARSASDLERYRLSAALPAAIRRGEFTVHYQPVVDLATGRVAGLEALARWQHPTLGTLRPARFIGLAEDTGLIVQLGEQLLELACRQAARWRWRTACPPYVSVNLAVAQLRQPGLAAAVASILDRTGLPPHLLQLELTETVLVDPDRDPATVDTLRAIRDLGVRTVLDDFGTGYSNLSYLPTLPLRGIKLARTFLRGPATPAGRWFLGDLVSLGHSLGLTVTGEGVETAEQARRLRDAECDFGQGWYLGHPVPADQVPDLLTTERSVLSG